MTKKRAEKTGKHISSGSLRISTRDATLSLGLFYPRAPRTHVLARELEMRPRTGTRLKAV